MQLVLGIDAAWTAKGSSGVALLACEGERCSVVAAAPSYASFIAHADGVEIDYYRPLGGVPDVTLLLDAARRLGGGEAACIALDLPMSANPITSRRPCDDAVARAFGGRGASVHSPAAGRPDAAVTGMVRALERAGYRLARERDVARPLLEVFPLATLVHVLGTTTLANRPRYKAAKTLKYWPSTSIAQRLDALKMEWQRIRSAMTQRVGDLSIPFPARHEMTSFAQLKPYEDALDAIVCAWVGAEYVAGRIERYSGAQPADDAIWIPPRQQPEVVRERSDRPT